MRTCYCFNGILDLTRLPFTLETKCMQLRQDNNHSTFITNVDLITELKWHIIK